LSFAFFGIKEQAMITASAKALSRRRLGVRQWEMAPFSESERQLAATLAKELRVSEICARLLIQRGHNTKAGAEAFMARRLDALHDPLLLPEISRAVERIALAVKEGRKILLFGDYDVDGLAATALLARFFRLLKDSQSRPLDVVALVPERKDGYGLNAVSRAQIQQRKPGLLILLDNGTTAHEAITQFAQAGIPSIVVDHHYAGGPRPEAVAVINPKLRGEGAPYPFDELCAAGLAFKLAWALAVHFSKNKKVSAEFKAFLLEALALAALGTLADVAPLKDENRILAHHGLQALARVSSPGLRSLLDSMPTGRPISATDVSFRLAPRLNAAGRCGRAAEALELLLTEDGARAAELAACLEKHNASRQRQEQAMLEEARAQVLACLKENPRSTVLVLASAAWQVGVAGIVASRIVEEFHRPAVLLCVDPEKGLAQGSGRSIRKLHLCEALACGREHLLNFGGHAAAAGLTLRAEKIPAFRAAFQEAGAAVLAPEDLKPSFHVEACVRLEELTAQVAEELEFFEPCGAGNQRPALAALGVSIPGGLKLMGKDERHISFFARQEDCARRVVGFDWAEHFNALCDLSRNSTLDIAFRPRLNVWRGEKTIELYLESFRPGNEA
jgi:single-stranded-DNA-specific exonuclease